MRSVCGANGPGLSQISGHYLRQYGCLDTNVGSAYTKHKRTLVNLHFPNFCSNVVGVGIPVVTLGPLPLTTVCATRILWHFQRLVFKYENASKGIDYL
jgi:hypothetical protein